ncbi:hypothetical protein [Kribbella sp. NPDC049584]|uniref:hypothetical protein n=1 Tax=Kribbella sp. NPDC049584 TaxID=3154833 RepID=UPI00341BC8B1
MTADAPMVDVLMAASRDLNAHVAENLGARFALSREDGGERLILDPSGSPRLAVYRVAIWKAGDGRTLVAFSLESEIPHMSSIIAWLGEPSVDSAYPYLVVNLNLKSSLGSLGVIVGLRGGSVTQLDAVVTEQRHKMPQPLMTKDWPRGFRGIREIHLATEQTIVASLTAGQDALAAWIAGSEAMVSEPASSSDLEYSRSYREQMKNLHRQGGVFDSVFGHGWVADMFRDNVLSGVHQHP